MRRTTFPLVLLGAATLVLLACHRTESHVRDAYHDVVGEKESKADRVDLNTATQHQIARLPGLSDDDAARIIANRPYTNKRAVVDRGVIGAQKFEKIEDYVYVSRAR